MTVRRCVVALLIVLASLSAAVVTATAAQATGGTIIVEN